MITNEGIGLIPVPFRILENNIFIVSDNRSIGLLFFYSGGKII